MIHCAVRWKIDSDSTRSAMVGAIWNPLAPAPMSAKRLPVMSRSAGHRAEWNDGPGERVTSRDVRQMREIERADGADDEARLERFLGAVGGLNRDLPARGRLVPGERDDRVPNRQCGASPYFSTTPSK